MLRRYLELPRAVHVLCIGTFVNRAGTFIVPFLTLYLNERLGLGERFATRTMGLYGLGAMAAALVGGHLADWIGRRTVMLLSLFGGAAMLLALSQLRTAWAITATVVALSMIAEMYRPAASAMIGDLVEPVHRPYAFGLLYVAINLGFAVGPVLGGMLAKYSFSYLFWGDAATSAAYGLIILLAIRETLPHLATVGAATSPAGEHVSLGEAVRHLLRDRTFQAFWLGGLLLGIMYMQSLSTFPLFLSHRGIGPQTYGRLVALNGAMIVLLQLPLTSWLSRFDRSRVVILAAVVTGTGFALTALASTIWQYAATIGVWTLGEIMGSAFVFAIATDLAPAKMRGRYMGFFSTSYSTAMLIGVPLGGEVLARCGGGWLWGGCFGLGLLSAMMYSSIRAEMRVRKHGMA